VYVFGGRGAGGLLNDLWECRLDSMLWSEVECSQSTMHSSPACAPWNHHRWAQAVHAAHAEAHTLRRAFA
jgi:hypothetical protein